MVWVVNVGSHIGQYRILRKIGVGGMGTVYLGEHILLGRRAAIKTLLPALSVQSEIVERFFTEARATSAITDHGVVQIFDFGYHVDGTAYIVMELLEGESLQTRIDRLGHIAPSDALRIGRQVAGSLAAAHACDIVHRDLKPDNIYLIADGEAQSGERTKILDFGICKLGVAGAEVGLTQSGTTMGTPVYMSPEQCRGAGTVDHRSDIYALGCVLFHMVAGRPPFEKEGAGEFIVAHLQETPPAPSTFVDGLPDLVDGVIMRCLEKSADDRFQSMTELQHALEYVIARISATNILVPPLAPEMPISPGYRSSYDLNIGPPPATESRGEPSVLVTADALPQAAKARRRKSNSSKSSAAKSDSTPPRARGSQPQSAGEWFVDSNPRVSTPALAIDDEDPRVTHLRPRSRAAVGIVLFGLVATLIAVLVMTNREDAVADAAPTTEIAETDIVAPPAPRVVAPAEPVATNVPAIAPDVSGPPDAATQAATAAAASHAVDRSTERTVKEPIQPTAKATRPKLTRPKAKPPQRRPASRSSITEPSTTTPPPSAKPESAPTEDLYDTR